MKNATPNKTQKVIIEKYNNNPERVTKYVTETFRANQLKYYTLATHEIYVNTLVHDTAELQLS